jgi:A/G-specific adenine glycosylase
VILATDRIAEFQRLLLSWYEKNRRELPWRDSVDPYAILVSEFMLQQTGVARVRPIFDQFVERFPSFEALAVASRLDVIRAWAGLGYNRRAINLHECAKVICDQYDGKLPPDPVLLRRLPGVGPYTVAAIRCFIFGEDVAAIDTNVRRVVGRVLLGTPATPLESDRQAASIVPCGAGANWNQALMDLGATCCTAGSPSCEVCPLVAICLAAPDLTRSRPRRVIAEGREPYLGSRRHLRGQIVKAVRQLEPGESLSVPDLTRVVQGDPTDDAVENVTALAASLARDGLISLEMVDGTARVGPPR